MDGVAIAEGRRGTARRPGRGPVWLWLSGFRKAARAALTRAERAHEARRALEDVPADLMRDIGLTPEDATGRPAWQADLPFFMQAGYGQNRR